MKVIKTQRFYEANVREIAEKLEIPVSPQETVVIHEKGTEHSREYALDGAIVIVVEGKS